MSIPVMDGWEYSTLLSCNGEEKLRAATYLPNGQNCDFWVVFLNGRSEYIEKYPNIQKDLGLSDNVGFLTWDHQGQGKSGGTRSHITSYDVFANDAQMLIRKFVGKKPFILMAHSMGGLVALYTIMKFQLEPERLILCSPLLKFPSKPFSPKVAKKISQMARLTGLSRVSTRVGKTNPLDTFVGNRYTHSKPVWEQMVKAPFTCPGTSFGWVHATQRALDFVYNPENLKKLNVPILIIGGSKEVVVNLSGFSEWTLEAQKYAPKDLIVRYKLILGARHELFSEIQKYRDETIKWIHEFIPQELLNFTNSKVKSA